MTTPLPDIDTAACLLSGAVQQLEFARRYTLELLDATDRDLWYTMPAGLPTHLAWQVGHLAVSEYGLLMFRVRGREPSDLELIPSAFRKAYSRQSVPKPNANGQPTPDELLDRLQTVHEQAHLELQQLNPAVLLEYVDMPWAGWPIKLGAILFCPLHENIHAGQIGLLRRALNLDPVR